VLDYEHVFWYNGAMRTIQTTCRFRLEPTQKQAAQMRLFACARRWVWNWALSRKKTHYTETKTTLTYTALAAELTKLKQQPESRQSAMSGCAIASEDQTQRSDFLHKLTTKLVKQFDVISIEDLSVGGLAKTKLSTSILDAGWGTFRQFLRYKADRRNTYLVVIGRF
jgi:IS605 OrfB family transposase